MISYLKKHYYQTYTFVFSALFLIIFLPFFLKGNSLISLADGFNQGYPMFIYCCNYIRETFHSLLRGEAIATFDFSIGFGEDIIGALSQLGFGEILYLFAALIPVKYAAYTYSFLSIFKIYLSGITFSIYALRKSNNKASVLVGAMIYSFSSWALLYGTQFQNKTYAMILFPLLISGLDTLLEDVSCKKISCLFVISLFLQALSGFYFLWMDAIFCFVYYMVNSLVNYENSKCFFRKTFNILRNSLLGVGMAGIFLLPTIFSYFNSSRSGDSNFSLLKLLIPDKKNLSQLVSNMITPPGYESGLGLPLLIITSVLILYTTHKEHKALKTLFAIFFIGYFIPLTGSIMNGFSYSIDRWAYQLFFLIACVVIVSLDNYKPLTYKSILFLSCIMFIWLIYSFLTYDGSLGYLLRTFIYTVLWIIMLSILFFSTKRNIGTVKIKKALIIFGIINVAINGLMNNGPVALGGCGWSACFKSFDELAQIENSLYGSVSVNDSSPSHNSFHRIDVNDTCINASLIFDNYSTNSYYSVTNKSINEFYTNMLISPSFFGSFIFQGLDSRQSLEMLMSVSNYLDSSNPDTVLKNILYLPLGFTYDTYIPASEIATQDALTKSHIITDTIILDGDLEDLFFNQYSLGSVCPWEEITSSLSYSNIDMDGDKLSVSDNSIIDITFNSFTPSSDYEYYLYLTDFICFDSLNNSNQYVDITVCDKTIRLFIEKDFKDNINDYLIQISPNCNIWKNGSIHISFPYSGSYALSNAEIRALNIANYTDYAASRNSTTLQNTTICGSRISGDISSDTSKILFMSIPYSPGWKCTIDDVPVEIYKANYGFSAIAVPSGSHKIVWSYAPPGLLFGIFLSIISWITFIIVIRKKNFSNIPI